MTAELCRCPTVIWVDDQLLCLIHGDVTDRRGTPYTDDELKLKVQQAYHLDN